VYPGHRDQRLVASARAARTASRGVRAGELLALGVKSTLAALENIERTFAAIPPR
jgi:hypothetical protein